MPVKTLVALATLGVGLMLAAAALPTPPPPQTGQARSFWAERITSIGAASAYAEFKQRYANADFRTQHTASHLFGEALYGKVGTDGITVCDPVFGDFGCEHGFTVAAIAGRGVHAVAEINGVCVRTLKTDQSITSCQHGIGHGILEYFGHDRLDAALAACPMSPAGDPFSGCSIGVFMEYNVPTAIAAPAGAGLRRFNRDDPYAPCPSLPERFLKPCYHQLPQWWDKVLAKDYERIGRLCAAASDTAGTAACFRGVGNVAGPSSRYDAVETVRKCRMMPNAYGQALCLKTASWGFYSVPAFRHLAPTLCRELDDAERQGCAPSVAEGDS